MFHRRPLIIVRPRGAADVMAGVRFAREHGLELTIRGGGHNVAGNAVCDDGLMLDLSEMRSVRVDAKNRVARVEPGCVLGDMDRETQAHGLVTPGGFISSTGVAGLTLGGGFGYTSRKLGLTVDNLISTDLVTAEGDYVHASSDENPDLFWALKGGGGNFGVVTSFEFRLHELGPDVLAGPVVHWFEDAPEVLRRVADAMKNAPDEVSTLLILRHAPPAPFLPEHVHGKMILMLAVIYVGDPAEGEAALAPLREIGQPIVDQVMRQPYAAFQSMFDATVAPGARNYWKAHFLTDFTPEAIDTLCEQAERMGSPESAVVMLTLGGAVAREPEDSAAYTHRQAGWELNAQARWHEPAEDDTHIAWSRGVFDAMAPYCTGGVYVNFISREEGAGLIREAYGAAVHQRLLAIKRKWDPDNAFHHNQNIDPAG
jgi:FAD/FMN-containing dehydrogenase